MAKRYAPAQQDISPQHNRLMYVLIKLLWLRSPQASRSSPEKASILKAYDRIQHRVLVDDPILCKAGIPLPKINTKTVRDFIRQQERLVNLHATRQPAVISKITSVSSEELPPAPRQPAVLPPPDYPVMEYIPTPSTAGTKALKGRTNMLVATPQPPPQPPLLLPVRRIPTTSTITRPVLPFVSQSPLVHAAHTACWSGIHPGHSACTHQASRSAGLWTEHCGRIVVVSIHTVQEEAGRSSHRAGR